MGENEHPAPPGGHGPDGAHGDLPDDPRYRGLRARRSTTSTGAHGLPPRTTTEAPPARVSRLGVGPTKQRWWPPTAARVRMRSRTATVGSLAVLHGAPAFLDHGHHREVVDQPRPDPGGSNDQLSAALGGRPGGGGLGITGSQA